MPAPNPIPQVEFLPEPALEVSAYREDRADAIAAYAAALLATVLVLVDLLIVDHHVVPISFSPFSSAFLLAISSFFAVRSGVRGALLTSLVIGGLAVLLSIVILPLTLGPVVGALLGRRAHADGGAGVVPLVIAIGLGAAVVAGSVWLLMNTSGNEPPESAPSMPAPAAAPR